MITCYCNRSEKDFWKMTPRKTIALIDQWKKIEIGREQLRAFVSNGGDPDDLKKPSIEKPRQSDYQAGEVMF